MALYPILKCLAHVAKKAMPFYYFYFHLPECVGEITTVTYLIHRLLMFPLEKDFNVIFVTYDPLIANIFLARLKKPPKLYLYSRIV